MSLQLRVPDVVGGLLVRRGGLALLEAFSKRLAQIKGQFPVDRASEDSAAGAN